MPMKKTGMTGVLTLAVFSAGCTVDFLTHDRFLDCDFNGTTLKLSSNHVENSIDLKPYVSGGGDCRFAVLFPGRHAGFSYLLLDATSQSNPGGEGPCARGTEQNLIWLKLDSKLQVQDAKSVLVESCLQNIHGRQAYDQSENRLTMKFVHTDVATEGADIHSRQSESELSYDNDHPEAGFTIEVLEVK